ncbi:MAG: hypothetical protein HZB21_01525 [Deltaproteobacteria bacterium]|nr:hypothetical protein [Deltaproteobacteria bacterium]
MASKGHHFPGITLVGIISGDTSLNIPDFRSAERTFQLVTQAAGRAGRGDAPGEVVIQTLNPDHYCFKSALLHDYCGFYKEEIKVSEDLSYPPFGRLCCLRIDGVREDAVVKAASFLKAGALALIKKRKDAGISVLGPAPALLSRLRGRHRWQMLIKGVKAKSLFAFVSPLKASFEAGGFSGVSLIVDMDPITVV